MMDKNRDGYVIINQSITHFAVPNFGYSKIVILLIQKWLSAIGNKTKEVPPVSCDEDKKALIRAPAGP